MRVLLSAYFCHPNRGSEASVGWNWLREVAKRNEVWALIYAGQGQAEAVQRAVSELPYADHIHLIPIAVPQFFAQHLYRVRYEIWHKEAFRVAEELVQRERIELIHHVTIAAWWNCGHLWQLGPPFVFGPISGAQRSPRAGYAFLPLRSRINEWIREETFKFAWRFWRRPRAAVRNAALVLVANPETETYVRKIRKHNSVKFMTECGIATAEESKLPRIVSPTSATNLLWSGRLIPTKNFGLLLEALAQVPVDLSWHLHVAGDGPHLAYWQQRVISARLAQRITFLGRIDYAGMAEEYQGADVFVFPSLREATGTALLEAMSHGLPAIALDIHGASTVLDDGCGVLVPVMCREQMVVDFRDAIIKLCRDRGLRETLGAAARQKIAAAYLWEMRGEQMQSVYNHFGGQ